MHVQRDGYVHATARAYVTDIKRCHVHIGLPKPWATGRYRSQYLFFFFFVDI